MPGLSASVAPKPADSPHSGEDGVVLTKTPSAADINMMSLAEAALYYGSIGVPVFPLVPNDKKPLFKAAHPKGDPLHGICQGECGALGHGFYDATTDAEIIAQWWAENPLANVGGRTGKASGFDVVDFDPTVEGQPVAPDDPRLAISPDVGPLVKTPRRGWHRWHLHRPGRCSKNDYAEKVDVKADGGYVVLPPSTIGGKAYKFDVGRGPEAPMVEWDDTQPTTKESTRAKVTDEVDLTDEAAVIRYIGGASEGNRDDRLNRGLFALGCLDARGQAPNVDAALGTIRALSIAQGLTEKVVSEKIDRSVEQGRQAAKAPGDLAAVETLYGLPPGALQRVERLPGSDRLDVVVVDPTGHGSRIRLSNDMSQRPGKFAQALAVATKTPPTKVAGDQWLAVRGALIAAAVDVEPGEGETATATVGAWLDGYLGHHWPWPAEYDHGKNEPFSHDGTAYLFGPNLLEWLRTRAPTSIEHLGDLLRGAGLEPCRPRIGTWRPRVWSIPAEMVPPEPFGNENLAQAIEKALDLLSSEAPWTLAQEFQFDDQAPPMIRTRRALWKHSACAEVDQT